MHDQVIFHEALDWIASFQEKSPRYWELCNSSTILHWIAVVTAINVRKVAERMRRSVINLPLETEKGKLSITVSIAVTQKTSEPTNLETLLNRAVQALHEAKEKGCNRVVISEWGRYLGFFL